MKYAKNSPEFAYAFFCGQLAGETRWPMGNPFLAPAIRAAMSTLEDLIGVRECAAILAEVGQRVAALPSNAADIVTAAVNESLPKNGR